MDGCVYLHNTLFQSTERRVHTDKCIVACVSVIEFRFDVIFKPELAIHCNFQNQKCVVNFEVSANLKPKNFFRIIRNISALLANAVLAILYELYLWIDEHLNGKHVAKVFLSGVHSL